MIEKSQVADLLGVMAAYDKRTVGKADVEAWWLIIGDLEPADCAQAVIDHYSQTRDWLMPADVRSRAKTLARTRRAAEARLELEAPAPDREQVAANWKRFQDELKRRGHKPDLKEVLHEDYRAEDARRRDAQAEVDQLRHDQGEGAVST